MDYSAMTTEMLKKLSVILRSHSRKQIGGFFSGETFILNYLVHTGGTALPSDIGSYMDISSARVAAILNSLERKKLIARNKDITDRRKTLVTITDEGTALVIEKRQLLRSNMESMLIELGEEDTREALRILGRIAELISVS